jgi:hypothetical protein
MEVSGQPHVTAALSHERGFWYLSSTRLDGLKSESKHFGGERNFLSHSGFEPRHVKLVA